jgi:7,8-dihydroneopterin aldolase/epimerase/oxygenase
MDIIYIRDLAIECTVGVWEWERRIRQRIVVDLELGTDIRAAAQSDAIADTVDYKAVSRRVQALAMELEPRLIERLAEAVAALVMEEFAVRWCRVRIGKPGAVRGAREVGIVIERGLRD